MLRKFWHLRILGHTPKPFAFRQGGRQVRAIMCSCGITLEQKEFPIAEEEKR